METADPQSKQHFGSTWMWAAIPVMAAVLVFGRAVGFGFTNWDDLNYIAHNPLLAEANLESLMRLLIPGGISQEQLYIPITYTSYWLEAVIFGVRPGVIHATNLCLHAINTLLVFAFIRSFTRTGWAACLGALLFAVHPLQAEAVVWCMGRKDLLATLFGMTAVHAYLGYIRNDKRWWLLPVVAAAFVLGVFAKPSLILLPIIFLLFNISSGKLLTRSVWIMLMFTACAAAMAYWITTSITTIPGADMPSHALRIFGVPVLVMDNLIRLVTLTGNSPIYAFPTFGWQMVAKILAILPAGYAMYRLVRFKYFFGLPLTFFALAFAPAVAVVFQGREFFTADRYTYFPMIAVAWFLAFLLELLEGKLLQHSQIVLSAWLSAAAVAAFFLAGIWDDNIALWQRAAEKAPNQSLVFNNLGSASVQAGDLKQAVRSYQRSIKLDPENYRAWNNLGEVQMRLNQHSQSILAYTKATELHPNYAIAHHNWGIALLQTKKPQQALKHFRIASEQKPDPESIYLMGIAFKESSQPDKAVLCFQKVLEKAPNHTEAKARLAELSVQP